MPAGATPKDGPSAGVTLVTALVSALTCRPARNDTCMTGEITLRGRVLPVGGIKEKILGAVARGLEHAVIPSQNVKDLEDIPADLRRKIDIKSVDSIDQLLPLVLTPEADSACERPAPAKKAHTAPAPEQSAKPGAKRTGKAAAAR